MRLTVRIRPVLAVLAACVVAATVAAQPAFADDPGTVVNYTLP